MANSKLKLYILLNGIQQAELYILLNAARTLHQQNTLKCELYSVAVWLKQCHHHDIVHCRITGIPMKECLAYKVIDQSDGMPVETHVYEEVDYVSGGGSDL